MGSDHDSLDVCLVLSGQLEDLQARCLVLHDQIRHDHVERAVAKLVLRGGQRVNDRAHVAGLAESLRHHLGVVHLVIDDQNLRVQTGFLIGTVHVATIVRPSQSACSTDDKVDTLPG